MEAWKDTVTQKHPSTLSSAGPEKEWGFDGHEKLIREMGIGVYGGTDKFNRMELGLYACPNARDQRLPVVIWLRTVKKFGGASSCMYL